MPSKYIQPPREKKNAATASNLPAKTFRLGRIKAAVWENEGEQKFYSVSEESGYECFSAGTDGGVRPSKSGRWRL
jgi:hypothetical protein